MSSLSRTEERDLLNYYVTSKDYYNWMKKQDFDPAFSRYCSMLETLNKGRILDVGCGVGQVVNRLTEERFSAVGIDVSPIGIRIAAKSGRGCFIIGSCTNLPFRDGAFESVGFYEFLEHTYHPELCLSEMVRVLKPEGRIVGVAPNFLRVVGLSRPYHWHIQGFRQTASNFANLCRKSFISRIAPRQAHFEFMQPNLNSRSPGADLDAVCVTNPIDLKYCLKKQGIKIVKETADIIHEKIGGLPLIKNMAGSVVLVGNKKSFIEKVKS